MLDRPPVSVHPPTPSPAPTARGPARQCHLGPLLWLLMLPTAAFGQVLPTLSHDGFFDWPIAGLVTDGPQVMNQGYEVQQNYFNLDGPSALNVCRRAHAGMDLTFPAPSQHDARGEPVYAVADGIVECVVPRGLPGRGLVVRHALPDGRRMYSVYAHLANCSGTGCLTSGRAVTRGQQIGEILDWALTDPPQPNNTHLHFELRELPYWNRDEQRLWSTEEPSTLGRRGDPCFGRGYAPNASETDTDANGRPLLDPAYRNPVDFILARRSPARHNAYTLAEQALRAVPSASAAAGLTVPAGSPLTTLGVVRGTDYVCGATQSDSDFACTQNTCSSACTQDVLPDCQSGACDWWYHVHFTDTAQQQHTGYLRAFEKGGFRSGLLIGEPLVQRPTPDIRPWRDPASPALVDYSFDIDRVGGRTVANDGTFGADMAGRAEGTFQHDKLFPELPVAMQDWAVWLDGQSSYVQVDAGAGLELSSGFQLDIRVRRQSQASDDVIASQWSAGDPGRQRWWLGFLAEDPTTGRYYDELRFVAKLAAGGEAVARYALPDCTHLDRWTRISARYDTVRDELRLYLDSRLVGLASLDSAVMAGGEVALRLGGTDDDVGLDTSRFHGGLDAFRFWSTPPVTVPPFPFGISRVATVPAAIQGQAELDKLFDGVTGWPETAIVHYVPQADVGVEMEFVQPTRLEGFRTSVAGIDFDGSGSGSYLWTVETAASPGGPWTQVLAGFETDSRSEAGNVRLPSPIEARLFRLTADRNNGDGVVHILEIEPVAEFAAADFPLDIVRVDTEPQQIQGQRELDKLFDGRVVWPHTAIIHFVAHADVAVQIELAQPTTLSAFQVSVAGVSFDGTENGSYLWTVEKADAWDGPFQEVDLASRETQSQNAMAEVPFSSAETAKVFRITADRNNGDGVVHILELRPVPVADVPTDLIPAVLPAGGLQLSLGGLEISLFDSQGVGTLSAERVDEPLVRHPGDPWFLGHYWSLDTTLPEGTFDAEITFPYSDEEVAETGLDEQDLDVFSFAESSRSWIVEDTATHDLAGDTLSVRTGHFSIWALGSTTRPGSGCPCLLSNPLFAQIVEGPLAISEILDCRDLPHQAGVLLELVDGTIVGAASGVQVPGGPTMCVTQKLGEPPVPLLITPQEDQVCQTLLRQVCL